MLDALVGANCLQMRSAPQSAISDNEDRYDRSHEPRHLRLSALAPLAAIVGLTVLALDVLPR